MSQLTTHVLDTTKGKPATGIAITLFHQQYDHWVEITKGVTNNDGRIPGFLPDEIILEKGIYKMHFETKSYFESEGVDYFYPWADIVFEINSADHYHVPLLLNPFGYSTYRGS